MIKICVLRDVSPDTTTIKDFLRWYESTHKDGKNFLQIFWIETNYSIKQVYIQIDSSIYKYILETIGNFKENLDFKL